LTYVDEPVKKAPGSPDSWWRTGDLGQRGRWGCLHLLDRVVDETPDIGSNLAIEDTLLRRLPELSEALLLPAADAGLPVPVICTRADATFDGRRWATAVKDFPPLADPIHLPWATVPRTSTWKVRRLELRRQLAAAEITPLPCTVRAGTR
jgi:acyl-coenzyme A synthetase/AMP-(fatty) acid ligase